MIVRFALATFVAAVAALPAMADEARSISTSQLQPDDHLLVRTAERIYYARVIDPSSGRTYARASRDGIHFAPAREVYFLGATPGRQDGLMMVSMGEIQVGMRIELGLDTLQAKDRAITAPVQSVEVIPATRLAGRRRPHQTH